MKVPKKVKTAYVPRDPAVAPMAVKLTYNAMQRLETLIEELAKRNTKRPSRSFAISLLLEGKVNADGSDPWK